jgi:hypothetical protein
MVVNDNGGGDDNMNILKVFSKISYCCYGGHIF